MLPQIMVVDLGKRRSWKGFQSLDRLVLKLQSGTDIKGKQLQGRVQPLEKICQPPSTFSVLTNELKALT